MVPVSPKNKNVLKGCKPKQSSTQYYMLQNKAEVEIKLTGRSAITWLIELQAAAVAPVCIAFMDTSIRKKYTAGMGSRTLDKINVGKKHKHSKPYKKIIWE